MTVFTIWKTYLPHFEAYSSTLIPASVAGVEPGAVLSHWDSAAPIEPDDRVIELPVDPVFIHQDGTYELLNRESLKGFDALRRGLPPAMAQNPGAQIKAYIIDRRDITGDQELTLLAYFGDIEYRILPFSDDPWRPLVDQFHADPGTERLYTEHIFHTPSAQLSAGQMSKLFNRKVSEDSIRRYRKGLPPRHGVRTVSSVPPQAANDDEFEPVDDGAAAHSLETTQTTDASADTRPAMDANANRDSAPEEGAVTESPVSAASAGEAIEPPDPIPNDEPPDKTPPDDEEAYNNAPETGGDERPTDQRDDEAHRDAAPTEPTEPPRPPEPAEPNHPGQPRGRGLLNPLKWGNWRMRDE